MRKGSIEYSDALDAGVLLRDVLEDHSLDGGCRFSDCRLFIRPILFNAHGVHAERGVPNRCCRKDVTCFGRIGTCQKTRRQSGGAVVMVEEMTF